MIIAEGRNVKLCVSDIETLAGCIDLGFYDPDTEEWFEFEISEFRNDLYSFVSFYKKENWDYIVGYNYIAFDAQVIEFIIRNYRNWDDLSNMEVVGVIYKFVQDLIISQEEAFKPFREEHFEIRVIDIFTLLGLNNAARWSSLKKIEFQLDMENVEEMPIHHSTRILTQEEIQEIKDYRKNDILATLIVFKLCLGDTTHSLYKGNNQVQLRFDIEEEFGLNCMNHSDIKIGDELLKVEYCKEKGIEPRKLGKGTFRKTVELKRCIPSYIEFKTPLLQDLLKQLKRTSLGMKDKWERKFKIGNTNYVQGVGGLHSVNNSEIYKANDQCDIETVDVSLTLGKLKFC